MATPKSQLPVRMKGQTTCINHHGRQLEFYCEKCKELVCPTCLSSIHKSHAVCELSEITPQNKKEIKKFIDRTEKKDVVEIGKYITSTETLLKDNASNFDNMSRELKKQTDKLKQELDILAEQTLSLYRKMKDDNTKLIQKYKHDLEMYDKQLKQHMQECKTAIQQGSHVQIYDVFCEIDSTTSTSLPVQPVLGTASFTPNKNPQGHLEDALGEEITSGQGQTLTDLDRSMSTSYDEGQSSTQQMSESKGKKAVNTYKPLPQTKVIGEWKAPCYIQSTCPGTDGQVWTKYEDTLTLLDRKGNVKEEVTHKVMINDISLSPTTHTLWVCDRDNNVLELASRMASERLIHRFSTEKRPMCICVTASNHVIVGMATYISKVTTKGQIVLTTLATGAGKPFVCSPWRISECPVTHNVAVIDFNDESDGGDGHRQVLVMDTDFKEMFVYRGDIPTYKQTPLTRGKPFDPHGLVYDRVGDLIIGDYDNRSVLLLSGGGEFLRIIHTGTGPTCAVCVDTEDVLWAVFESSMKFLGFRSDTVKLLQHSNE